MSSARTLVERTDEAPARRERPVIGRAIALVLRLLVAAVLSLALCRLIWQFVPDTLSDPKGVLGYPIFANFDITRYYDAFYVLAIAFPLGAIVAYHVLGRLRRRRRGGRAPLFPVGLDTPGTAAAGTEPRARAVLAWAVVRASLPALVVALEVSVVSSPRARDVSAGGIVAGAAYLVVVVVLGLLLLRLQARPGAARQGPAWSARALATTMSAVDSILGVTTVFLLYGVSLRTSIAVGTAPRVVHYPWFPLWLAVVASLALGWWTVGALRRRTGHAAIVGVEARTLTIVGAIAIFMTTASLPGALGGFSGFDDAQFLAGPQLVFVHGLTPWSQFVPFHGLLFDVFGSVVGMVVFGNTRWGAVAGQSLFLLPATWLALYVMAVHFLKRWRMFVAAFTLAVVLGVFGGFVDYRWLFLPYLFVALDKVLRTASRGWTILFTVGVIAQAVLVPEGDLITVSVLVVVALFELATRRRGAPLRSSFARTRWCIATALVVGACFAAYLAATGSLGAFIDYYRTIISVGNGLEGGQPIGHRGLVLSFGGHSSVRFTVELLLPGVLVVMTAWLVTAKLRARMAFTTTEWVMVAAALGVLGYYPEALARLDTGHVAQMFSVAIPLVVLWGAELLHLLDTARTRSRPRAPAGGPRPLPARLVLLPGLAVATMTAVVVWAPASLGTTLDTAPSHFHARAPAEPPALL
ncbi:MAG TPA: hypothetical protein VLZ77_04110, partial [Acidimicrobiales bacterium]|nr:hypothetical protein [Acidimicrobiales bacterium]